MTLDTPKFLSSWWQRGEFLLAMIIIHVLDHLVSDNLTKSGVLNEWGNELVAAFEHVGGIALALLAVACLVAIIKPFQRVIVPLMAVYLSFAVVHLVVNVVAVLLTAEIRRGQALINLWDVVVVYSMGVFIFAAWYWFLDKITPGGAFLFPLKPGEESARTLLDYLFLSFNTSSTFGPTTEPPTTRPAKVLMMMQVCSSLVVLMVLLARAISG
ncbi:MAG TPA: hypothetical protein DCE18_03010 [Syntrophobacteraceae bacterium]|nr:hypothetical protein [Syntrophobacteraceae bacterium]